MNFGHFDGNSAVFVINSQMRPLKIKHQNLLLDYLRQAFPKIDAIDMQTYSQNHQHDNRFAFFFSISDRLSKIISETAESQRQKFIVIDYSWFEDFREKAFRFTVGGAIPKTPITGTVNHTLLARYNIDGLTPARLKRQSSSIGNRKTIFIVPPDEKSARFFGISQEKWLEEVHSHLNCILSNKLFTIKVRQRNDTQKLSEILKESFIVICMHSAVGISAFMAGIPVITHGPSPLPFHTFMNHSTNGRLDLTTNFIRSTHAVLDNNEVLGVRHYGQALTRLAQTQLFLTEMQNPDKLSALINRQVSQGYA